MEGVVKQVAVVTDVQLSLGQSCVDLIDAAQGLDFNLISSSSFNNWVDEGLLSSFHNWCGFSVTTVLRRERIEDKLQEVGCSDSRVYYVETYNKQTPLQAK